MADTQHAAQAVWPKHAFPHPQSNHEETEVNPRTQGINAIVGALFVLLSAIWDPRISIGVLVIALAALGVYRLVMMDRW